MIKIDRKKLIKLGACQDGLDRFVAVHSANTVKLSDCFDSNTTGDIFWAIAMSYDILTKEEIKEFKLIVIGLAESVLSIFEYEYPDDKRPRIALEKAREFLDEQITSDELIRHQTAAYATAAVYAAATACACGDTAAYAAAAADACATYATYATKEETKNKLRAFVVSLENDHSEQNK